MDSRFFLLYVNLKPLQTADSVACKIGRREKGSLLSSLPEFGLFVLPQIVDKTTMILF